MSPAEPKNVAGGAHKCRRRSPKRRKWGCKEILGQRSPTNAGGAGGLPVLNVPVGSEGDQGPKKSIFIIYIMFYKVSFDFVIITFRPQVVLGWFDAVLLCRSYLSGP